MTATPGGAPLQPRNLVNGQPSANQSTGQFGFPSEEEVNRLVQQRFQESARLREADVARGREIAAQEFGEGSLGRVDAGRSPEVDNLIRQRQELVSQARGETVSPQEEAARRALDVQAQTNLRQLRGQLGAQGVQGGLNIEQQAQVLGQRQLAESQLQGELARQRSERLERGLGGLETSVLGARESEFQREQLNAQRALQERLGRTTLPLAIAQQGIQERGASETAVRSALLTQAQLAAQAEAQKIAAAEAAKPAAQTVVQQSGGKIICGELYRQGLLSERVYRGDLAYATEHVALDTKLGYWFWATPLVRLMQRSSLLTSMVRPIASAWAQEMAFRMGAVETGSLLGRLLTKTAEPACNLLGKTIRMFRKLRRA